MAVAEQLTGKFPHEMGGKKTQGESLGESDPVQKPSGVVQESGVSL